jgi:hypothetical protein
LQPFAQVGHLKLGVGIHAHTVKKMPAINRVDEYAPPFMGLDCGFKAEDNTKAAGALTSSWFEELYSHSNFNFLGAYLTHGVSMNTGSTTNFTDNPWTNSLKTLSEQGWGVILFYVGLNPGIDPSPATWDKDSPSAATTKEARKTGTRHGKHIKVAISKLLTKHKTDNNGCVVYIDNEGGILKPAWRTYYNAVFEEMRMPGPENCQPVRPGLYARDQAGWTDQRGVTHPAQPNASEMLDSNPDLLVWLLDHHDEAQAGRRINKDKVGKIPDEVGDNIHLNPQLFEIRARRRNEISSGRTITDIPVGCQGFLNYELHDPWADEKRANNPNAPLNNYPRMPTRALTTKLTPQTPWDFDMSFVRDPRYPVASPRVRCRNSTICRGFFAKIEKQMRVTVSNAAGTVTLTGAQVEPDAPLLLADEQTLFTIDTAGNIIMSTFGGNPAAWTPFVNLTSGNIAPPLRRSRAMRANKLPDGSIHLFYIARDLSFQTLIRHDPSSQWAGPTSVVPVTIPMIHAFTNFAVTTDIAKPRSIDLIAISETSHLQLTAYTPAPSANATPLLWNQTLENQTRPPTLLQGTSIIAVNPHPLSTLNFTVSRTLMLSMFATVLGAKWTGPTTLGDPARDRLFAHTRLAYNVINPTLVQVGAICYEGDPVVYTIAFDNNTKTWGLAALPTAISTTRNPELFPRTKTKPPALGPQMPLRQGEADARQWSINPFGDLNFAIDPSGTKQTVLVIPGSGSNTAVDVLYRRIAVVNEDWYLRV